MDRSPADFRSRQQPCLWHVGRKADRRSAAGDPAAGRAGPRLGHAGGDSLGRLCGLEAWPAGRLGRHGFHPDRHLRAEFLVWHRAGAAVRGDLAVVPGRRLSRLARSVEIGARARPAGPVAVAGRDRDPGPRHPLGHARYPARRLCPHCQGQGRAGAHRAVPACAAQRAHSRDDGGRTHCRFSGGWCGHHRERVSPARRRPAGLRFDQQPRPDRDQERRHSVHHLGARRQLAGRSRLRFPRPAAASADMRRFFARASRHVGFQIGAVLLLLFVGTALVSIVWTPHAVDELQMRVKLMPSSAAYPLGTDHLGRDVLSRIMVGAQTSIAVGLIAVGIGLSAGVALGAWAAARGGWVDEALSRTSDLIFAFPAVLIAILITSVLGASAQNAILAIAIFNIPVFARVTRGAALSMWSRDFVRAATAMGQGPLGITVRHVLPNIASVLIVQATIQFAVAILAEAGLSYLGLGAQPPVPSWGRMLRDAQTYIFQAPELAIWPGLAIGLAVLGLNMLGDGLRDLLDPRLRLLRVG